MADALFDLGEVTPPAEPADPKGMRELLFGGLVAELEAAVADETPDFAEDEYLRDPDGTPRSGSPYWQAHQRAGGLRAALGMVRSKLATHEEYLRFERENTRRTWTNIELTCERHRDTCPRCTQATQEKWRTQRTEARLEKVRATYVVGLHDILNALDSPTTTITLPQVRAALQQLQNAAHRTWTKAEPHE
ncbi:hypothetical protein [Streptosporangium sp. NPDC049078]|uniref:hypothetical protein n=1 Tax=Streptosporangium sp. NPDC049078 TaxID=3155767 RepID=UPI0034487D22